MKRIILVLAAVHLMSHGFAQTLAGKVSILSCQCLGDLNNLDSLDIKFRKCFGPSLAEVTTKDKDIKFATTVENIRRTADEAFKLLPSVCPSVRKHVLKKRAEKFYAPSASALANEYYQKGNDLLSAGDFDGAARLYMKAIKEDPNLVIALDNLAICYRKTNQFEEAIKYYKESLKIFPEGDLALVNLGSLHIMRKEFAEAKEIYSTITVLYPENPEGYYGLARIALLQEDYEGALVLICRAHVLYAESNSPHQEESGKIIGLLYSKLKETGKENFFQETTARYNIEFEFKGGK